VQYLRAYTTGAPAPTPASAGIVVGSSTVATYTSIPQATSLAASVPGNISTSPNGNNNNISNGAFMAPADWRYATLAGTVGIGLGLLLITL
jgi:hypothetical protein